MSLKKTIAILCIVLSIALAACGNKNPNGLGQRDFTIEELAEAAAPAVAYIETSIGSGSGFVISPKGIIVTNFHVLEGADSAIVEIAGNTYSDVTVLAANADLDIAILRVQASDLIWLPPVQGAVKQGESVVALGNPGGLKGSVSEGIISSTNPTLEGVEINLLQTTAPISPGSSGGPLLNMKGEFVGITTFSYIDGQNLNFAIPADVILSVQSETGEEQALSEVFGHESLSFYNHNSGDMAVSLSWQGAADVDLEIWSEDLLYLGDAAFLGECRDVTSGGAGEEYFVFRDYPDTDFTNEHQLQRNFSSGRFIISPFFNQGDISSTSATLKVTFPHGGAEEFSRDIYLQEPLNQWVAILVDVDQRQVKLLDFFPEAALIGFLEWNSAADLDLVVWDYYYEDFFIPAQLGGQDVQNGLEGIEVFQFGSFSDYDFSSGLMDIDVWMDYPGDPVTDATVTLFSLGEKFGEFEHQFTSDPRGDYFWQVISLDAETLEYSVQEVTRQLISE